MGQVENRFPYDLIPAPVRSAIERLRTQGHRVWLVGGAVRDHLWGFAPKDWDIATEADLQEVGELFPRVVPVGLEHGTVVVRTGSMNIEVTRCPRRGLDGLLDDLGRRDFTVNAIAVSLPDGGLIDPHGGRRDLEQRCLRAVEDPHARFREDPLRTLRAARFVSVYGFTIAPHTFSALQTEARGLHSAAGERIREEMLKLLLGSHVVRAFKIMKEGNILKEILPELQRKDRHWNRKHPELDACRHTAEVVRNCPERWPVRLAALFHCLGPSPGCPRHGMDRFDEICRGAAKKAERVMLRWRMSRKDTERIKSLVENQPAVSSRSWTDPEARKLLARVGEPLIEDLLDLARADLEALGSGREALERLERLKACLLKQIRSGAPLHLSQLAVDGDDVIKFASIPPGPEVGRILRWLHRLVLEHPEWNKRSILCNLIKNEYDSRNK